MAGIVLNNYKHYLIQNIQKDKLVMLLCLLELIFNNKI